MGMSCWQMQYLLDPQWPIYRYNEIQSWVSSFESLGPEIYGRHVLLAQISSLISSLCVCVCVYDATSIQLLDPSRAFSSASFFHASWYSVKILLSSKQTSIMIRTMMIFSRYALWSESDISRMTVAISWA